MNETKRERIIRMDLNHCFLCATCAADLHPSYVDDVVVDADITLPACEECGGQV